MIFNSIVFLIFSLIFFTIWPFVRKTNNPKWLFIVIMSFIFYGWWDWRFLFLLIGSGLIDYFAALFMEKYPLKRKLFLLLSLAGNLGTLFIFKYSGFVGQIFDDLFYAVGIDYSLTKNIPEFTLILPVGISFYTFQSMSYTIDAYKGQIKPVRNILLFYSFLAMFPQLVAGPIIRARDLIAQLIGYKPVTNLMVWNGIKLMVFGLFQKVVIADNLALLVDSAYQQKTVFDSGAFWWVAVTAFAFQIYCDFSGYSLIARGMAKIMGYHFKMNFNHPYHSMGFRDFWMRWHISLSSWFRDYLYIPLGGSRKGFWNGMLFMSITMVVSGIWHGAAYTFIVWGALHAFYAAFERITQWPKIVLKLPLGGLINILITFVLALFAWNYFRADSMSLANKVSLKLLFPDINFSFVSAFINQIFFLIAAIAIEVTLYFYFKNRSIRKLYINYGIDVIFVALALLLAIFFRGPQIGFIYFQF